LGQEENRDHNPGQQISHYDLQKLKIAAECEGRSADDGKRASLRRHDREGDGPPRSSVPAEKIVLQAALAFAELSPKPRDRDQVDRNGCQIEKTHEQADDSTCCYTINETVIGMRIPWTNVNVRLAQTISSENARAGNSWSLTYIAGNPDVILARLPNAVHVDSEHNGYAVPF
jgi:hypothetical protein